MEQANINLDLEKSEAQKTAVEYDKTFSYVFNADKKAKENYERRMAKKPHIYERKKDRAKKYGYGQ